MRRKLKSRRGETLVETLAAILMVSLSSALFLTLITAGVRISAAGDDKMQQLNEEWSLAEEAAAGGGHAATGTITLTQDGRKKSVEVTYYGAEGGLRSYRQGGAG